MSLTSSSVANTAYTIVPADNTHDRRIYGMIITNTSAVNHNACTLWLSDGTTDYQMGKDDISANAGNSISVGSNDIFTSSDFSGLLTYAMADNMGVWYFNLPKTWSMKFTYTNTLSAGNAMTFTTFGEKYDGVTHRFTSTHFQQTATFSTAGGTTRRDLVTSAAHDRRIYGIEATSTDSTARTLAISLNDGTTNYLIYTISVLANSGNNTAISAQDLFYDAFIQGLFVRTADPEGISYYFNLPAGWSLNGVFSVAPAAQINIKTIGETYE
jgi:hypothetical protein